MIEQNNRTIHILGVCGSLRKGSYNQALLRAASELLPEGVTLEMFDISAIPLYNGDIEAIGLPEPVQYFRSRIANADALLIVTPEYNYSVPGVLKNAIDWASRPPQHPFTGKPLAIMGCGARLGSARAQYHLRQIAVFLNMFAVNKPEVLVPYSPEKFDSNGKLIDETALRQIRDLLVALVAWTNKLQ